MFAVFGTVEFLVSACTGWEAQLGADYVEHALIGRKPRLQAVGDRLDEVRVEMLLHNQFCNPTVELARLQGALRSRGAAALVMGTGAYLGQYVITELTVTTRHSDAEGLLLSAEVRVTLREFTGGLARPRPPAVRPAGSELPMPARTAPPAAAQGAAAVQTASSLAGAVTAAKGALATASSAVATVATLRSLATMNPLAAAQRLDVLAGNVTELLPRLGVSADTMAAFGNVAATATDAARVASSVANVRTGLASVAAAAKGATGGDVVSRLTSIEALTSRAALDIGTAQKPLASLAAKAAIRTAW